MSAFKSCLHTFCCMCCVLKSENINWQMVKSHNCVFKATMPFMIGGGGVERQTWQTVTRTFQLQWQSGLNLKKKNHFPNKCKPSRLKIFHCDWVWNSLTAFGNPKKHPPPPKAAHPWLQGQGTNRNSTRIKLLRTIVVVGGYCLLWCH